MTQPATASQLLETELERGYVIGPFANIPYKNYRISLLGIAESKYSKKKRLFMDMSAPHDNDCHPSLNELNLSYVTIDSAIKIIKN